MTLDDIVAEWADCRRCGLAETRRSVVVGEAFWPPEADGSPLVLVVGEAPGRKEDETGRPFVGQSGSVLREEILEHAGVRLGYVTNILGCRPPANRDPQPAEVAACAPRLAQLAEVLAPDALLLVGRHAAELAVAPLPALAGIPSASIAHPAWLLRQGHPTAATRAKVTEMVATVRALLARVGGGTKTPECAHEWGEVGVWRNTGGATAVLVACALCGRVRPPGGES